MKKKGVFVCIEGLDASGKTTHAHRLVRNLRREGFDALYTTEPSLGEIGRFIRTYILQRKRRVPSVVEALLFAVDRFDHVEKEVKPALEEGKIVVSDRYVYSSLAYQGAAGLDIKWIEEINRLALTPDLAIYIDVPPEVVVKRMRRKKSVMERLGTQRRVREVYMKFVEKGKLVSVDGNRRKNEVAKDILTVVLDFLKNYRDFQSV
ncbi:MAG: dTMP kinase [Candidatus Bathyarchaeota archaeon]|nr:dTMP kinase [Candidatus Bathyarchaeota archaeon]MDH5622904.1 dTMP kinase [Candidatus Bathyarchaeota archaeon]MDH5635315.1 dTMP kinase [Candidatus Bathyarchaeota archaeon]MDH5701154.1 dTMP kinase [Candidatus Bathyarchaeota archaeon]